MDSLLAMIGLWLSFNLPLPTHTEQPNIEFVSKQEILFRRYRAFTTRAQKEVLAAFAANDVNVDRRDPVAIYDDVTTTIYLPQGWSSSSAADLSVLVHEMVHHAQRQGGMRYECPAQREVIAYQAQDRWLGMFGKSLLEEFNLDEFTIKVSTACGF